MLMPLMLHVPENDLQDARRIMDAMDAVDRRP